MPRFPALLAAMIATVIPCAGAQTVRVAAAADLEPVLPAIFDQFRQATGIQAEATYQASAALTTQIENGAPFDLFLSANVDYPQRLISEGVAEGEGEGKAGRPIVYARGTLVLWTRKDAHFPAPSLELLRDPALKRLAIANPDRAPYGKAAVAALEKLGLYDGLKPKLVTAENIAQAAQFVDSGNADAGLISLTSAMTPRLAASGQYFVLPKDLYPPIDQGAVLISKTGQRAAAKKLLVYLMSPPVQEDLRKHGLTPGSRAGMSP
ncbi:MAG TPA: molybdate ABC transporter substrate-binding protein [Terracidiphilus sp.]|nr:molybdate ABC transporter substrate-binding protein [Terracidiphilus sp.]